MKSYPLVVFCKIVDYGYIYLEHFLYSQASVFLFGVYFWNPCLTSRQVLFVYLFLDWFMDRNGYSKITKVVIVIWRGRAKKDGTKKRYHIQEKPLSFIKWHMPLAFIELDSIPSRIKVFLGSSKFQNKGINVWKWSKLSIEVENS